MSAGQSRVRRSWMRFVRAGLLFLLVVSLCPEICAQSSGAENQPANQETQPAPIEELPPVAEAPDAPTPVSLRPRTALPPLPMPELSQIACDSLTRLAITALREMRAPSRDDYRSTALAFRVAQRLRPDDVELVHLELDAWAAAGDEDRVLDATARLIRLDPNDTIAQLRLISSRIRILQDADQRMAAYDRLLGSEGSSLDPSVRSRLALDSALLARETGDEQGFVSRLTTATTLDVTNKSAAALYATYFLDRTNDPKERAEILGNIILSDPMDPGPYTNLALEMMRRGAFAGAKRFYERAGDLQQAAGFILTTEDLFDRILCIWMTESDTSAGERLNAVQAAEQAVLSDERRRKIQAGFDPGPTVQALLPPLLENLRLAMAFARGDADAMAESARNIHTKYEEELRYVQERTQGYERLTEEEARSTIRTTRLRMALACLWGNFLVEEAQEIIARMREAPEDERPEPAALQRFDGLLALRSGDAPLAAELLAPLAETDSAARLGLGMAMEAMDRQREALGHYAMLAGEQSHTALGAGARKRIETLLARNLSDTPETRALIEETRQAPPAKGAEDVTRRIGALDSLDRGDLQAAFDALTPLAETDPASRLALGLTLERLGRTEEAKGHYRRLVRDESRSTFGNGARQRIESLKGAELRPSAETQVLEDFAKSFAPWLDKATSAPHQFMSVSAQHTAPRIDVFGRGELRIRVRNISRWPLAVGPEQPISSLFMLTPKVVLAGREVMVREVLTPEVLTLTRRLRLNPGEELNVVVWPLRGATGLFLDISAVRFATVRWRLLQGYRIEISTNYRGERQQRYLPGPMTIVTESDVLSRDPTPDQTDVDKLIEAIGTADDRSLMESILLAAVTGVRRREGLSEEAASEARQRLAEAIAQRWPALNDYQRVYAICVGLRGGLVPSGGPIENAAQDDASPFVRAVMLLAPWKSPAHRERVARIAEDPDPDMREMAGILLRRPIDDQTPPPPEPPPEPVEDPR